MALISTDFERWLINRPSCSSLLTPSHPPPSVHCQPFETSMGGVADRDNSLFSVSRFPRRPRISARIRYPVWRNPICPAPQPRVQVILFGPLKGWGRLEGGPAPNPFCYTVCGSGSFCVLEMLVPGTQRDLSTTGVTEPPLSRNVDSELWEVHRRA